MRFLVILCFLFSSCVTQQVVLDLKNQNEKLEKHNQKLKIDINDLESTNKELDQELIQAKTKVSKLLAQVEEEKKNIFKIKNQLTELKSAYDILAESKSNSIEKKAKETKEILLEINKLQDELQKKEDKLYNLQSNLNIKQKELINYKEKIDQREERINELESIIKKQDSSLFVLKENLVKSLIDFTGKGLDININKGRIYIMLEQDLLFNSGSWSVDTTGKIILRDLIEVLSIHEDINIIIEGHTDNRPYKGSGNIKDNWDLSVMRATSIVKILTFGDKINASRLTAAGRGEFNPITDNDSDLSRSKNRRIEIILYPSLDRIYDYIKN